MRTYHAVVLSHVAFEDLGTLEAPLRERGFEIEFVTVPGAHLSSPEIVAKISSCDLLVILGGPIGVYDHEGYPFLKDEIASIGERLKARKPTLGICLGAQLMAAALGARVYPGQNGAEIGWLAIEAARQTATPEWFRPLLAPGLQLFHWHGDTFDLPEGAVRLAQTAKYANQAFAVGDRALGLQFHPEVTANGLEPWYVGHACELHHAGIAVARLRSDAHQHAAALEKAAGQLWKLWLDSVLDNVA